MHILCPFDFSAVSAQALSQASILAQRTGARLTVLHVFLSVMPPTAVDSIDEAALQAIEPTALDELHSKLVSACEARVHPDVDRDLVVVGGAPVPVVLDYAAVNAVDLIVMGTHGTSGFQHLLLGSVTEKVLRKAACPVLTVPPRAGDGPVAAFRHAVCAVDFSDSSRQAARSAAAMVEGAGAKVTLLHVLEWPWHEPPVPGMEGVPAAQVAALLEYRRYLESSASDGLKALGSTLGGSAETVALVRFGKPYIELLDAAREVGADLIVLGVQGRGAVDIGFFGSTANQVVRRASCPVLTVRS